jgi:arylsulfatase A-like enzyme
VRLLLALASCHESRKEQLEQSIGELEGQVEVLQAEASTLQQALASQPPPSASVRGDHDPEGFDPNKPLPAGDTRPDLILLSLDTVRADHLGAYGYERDTSPTFDALGERGTVFEQAWAPSSWTLPSHATMLSGQLPLRHGAMEDHLRIAADVPLLQEALGRAGYNTAGIVAALFVSSRYGFERGFSWFQDFGIQTKETNNLTTVDADHVFHQALGWAQQQPAGKPLFLFLHVYDAHYQYDPPAPWNERFDRKPQWGDEAYKNYSAYEKSMISRVQLEHQIAQYDESIAFVDHEFGELLAAWERSGRQAIVMVTADHGEEFGERGSWGHAHTLWPEQLHVPWIVSGPGIEAQRVSERVGLEDLAPTLAELAGASFVAPDGHSRAPSLRGGPPPAERVAGRFAETSRFKEILYRWHDPPYDLYVDIAMGTRSLCKLDDDPTCRTNVYRDHVDQAETMFTDMYSYLGEPWRTLAPGRVDVKDGVLFVGGVRKNLVADLPADTTFAVHPADAWVRFSPADGQSLGPWRPLGATTPGERCPVSFSGRTTIGTHLTEITEEEIALLEQLGYVHEEDDQQDSTKSGPEACP